ncbi:MAG: bifunctional hydroxymethylpyrimidine kinase/phosphomethylpyrimidine kinase [Planctomycetota bacterium]
MRTALTIAGSDPSGGAGIQGDLKTFTRAGVYGMAALTALTVQNTQGVRGVHDVPPAFVAAQLDAIFDDLPVHAAKTGMLSRVEVIEAIVDVLTRRGIPPLVVDPVMVSTSGDALIDDDATIAIMQKLFPLAAIVTPNLPEAERLCGFPLRSASHRERAAQLMVSRGAGAVLIKGGHDEGDEIVDLLYFDNTFHEFRSPRIDTAHTHGTGCALAAGIAAQLALGTGMPEAVERARNFVRNGLENAVVLGKGTNPLNHLA